MGSYKLRRLIVVCVLLLVAAIQLASLPVSDLQLPTESINEENIPASLAEIPVKGRAPKTGYQRRQFGDGWETRGGCDTRNIILARDLQEEVIDERCNVTEGILNDPYTGNTIRFSRREGSNNVQIDHVVALSDAWQKGAQQLTYEKRVAFANDPLNLLAVDGPTNQKKSDGDAATWLPPNKAFRCQYIQRQISVKQKYILWVTSPERDAMARILGTCAQQNS